MKIKDICLRFLAFSGLFISVYACVEPFQPKLNGTDASPFLVVEGLITDEEGPFRVHLMNSGPVDALYYNEPFVGAAVLVVDDKGNSWNLNDKQNGWYESDKKDLKGIPGTSYTLNINDGRGNRFESTAEIMQEVPAIDSVYGKVVRQIWFENNTAHEDNWLKILLDSHDPSDNTKYWQWKFEETWEIRIPDQVLVKHGSEPPFTYTHEFVSIDPEKEVCWVTMPSSSILIKSTSNSLASDIKAFQIQSLGPGEDKLYIRYSLLIKQYALNRESYDYWKKLMDYNQETDGIYSKIPAPAFGNITCVSGNKQVLGYFSASAVKMKRIFINVNDYQINTVSPYASCIYLTDPNPHMNYYYFGNIANTNVKLWLYDTFCLDCRQYGTNIKPAFW